MLEEIPGQIVGYYKSKGIAPSMAKSALMRSFQDYDEKHSQRPGASTALVSGQPLLVPQNAYNPSIPQPYRPNVSAQPGPPPFQNINMNYPAPPQASDNFQPAQISLQIKDRFAKQ